MITFEEFRLIFDIEKCCSEILFSINGSAKFSNCWMGTSLDKNTGKYGYWFGLTQDGNNAYDFLTFDEFANAKVFDGRSLVEVWENVTLLEINACDASEMLKLYLP